MELGDSKSSELGVCPWLIQESHHSLTGESIRAWDWRTTQDLLSADQKGGSAWQVPRLGTDWLVLVALLPSISVPVRAVSPAQLSERGLFHIHCSGGECWPDLLWTEGQCPDTGGRGGRVSEALKNQLWHVLPLQWFFFWVKRPRQCFTQGAIV